MEASMIIKALECCTRGRKGDDIPCTECPYNECNIVGGTSERQTSGTCQGWLMKDALAFINAQDEQIFQLENRLKECENGYAGTLHIESCKLLDAEERVKELTEENEKLKSIGISKDIVIESLAEENEKLKNICNSYALQYGTARDKEVFLRKEREDTVREFAERLKAVAYQSSDWSHGEHPMVVEVDDIEEILNENTEEEKK